MTACTCGKYPSHKIGATDLCCECYVRGGHAAADWHPGCMKAHSELTITRETDETNRHELIHRALVYYSNRAPELGERTDIFLVNCMLLLDHYESAMVALKNLMDRLEEVQSEIDDRFIFAENHGIKYNGPTYGEQLREARAALERVQDAKS